MEIHEVVNKSHIVIETGVPFSDGTERNISDNVLIATLATAAFVLFVAIGIVVWRCSISTDDTSSIEHTPLGTPPFSSYNLSVKRSELNRLLHKYDGVKDASDVHLQSSDWDRRENQDSTCTDRRKYVGLPSSSTMTYSPWTSTPERLRKSSGSSMGVTHRLSSSDYKNASLLGERSTTPHNDSLLADDSVFPSPLGQYPNKRLWKVTSLNEYCPPSAASSPNRPSSATASRRQNLSQQKRFYFAWPEEDEEDNATAWSPLLLKLSTEMSRRESLFNLTGSVDGKDRSRSYDMILDKKEIDDKGVVPSKESVDILTGIKNTWV